MTTDIIQQAADVIDDNHWHVDPNNSDYNPSAVARNLADAGLLVTAEQRAVLDAAVTWRERHCYWLYGGDLGNLAAAVDALRAATPKEGE
jgi:hypothetical protein